MRDLNFILQKRVYWCSLFTLISLLFAVAAWKLGYQDIVRQRLSLSTSYSAFREQANTQESMATVNNSLQVATQEVNQIREKLHTQSEFRNPAEIIPYVVKLLDLISSKHDVKLQGVKPLNPEVLLMFEERPFDITISGDYKNLFKWVDEAESVLSPMAIKSFTLRPGRSVQGVEMRVRVVSYSVSGEQT